MATLKDHQQAMVDLLASGSGIPASASRLAHAMHDVLEFLTAPPAKIPEGFGLPLYSQRKAMREQETTPGLNDKALAEDIKALQVNSPDKWPGVAAKPPVSAENRVKELENTIRQLKANLAHERACVAELNGFLESAKKTETKLRAELEDARAYLDIARHEVECVRIAYDPDYCVPEQAGCRKPDTQVCEHDFRLVAWCSDLQQCLKCGATKQ